MHNGFRSAWSVSKRVQIKGVWVWLWGLLQRLKGIIALGFFGGKGGRGGGGWWLTDEGRKVQPLSPSGKCPAPHNRALPGSGCVHSCWARRAMLLLLSAQQLPRPSNHWRCRKSIIIMMMKPKQRFSVFHLAHSKSSWKRRESEINARVAFAHSSEVKGQAAALWKPY